MKIDSDIFKPLSSLSLCRPERYTRYRSRFTAEHYSDTSRDTQMIQICFYQRDAMLARVLAMALRLSVSVTLCLSQVGVLSKRLNESGWFLARELLSAYPTLCYKEIRVYSKGYFPLELDSKLWTYKNFATS